MVVATVQPAKVIVAEQAFGKDTDKLAVVVVAEPPELAHKVTAIKAVMVAPG